MADNIMVDDGYHPEVRSGSYVMIMVSDEGLGYAVLTATDGHDALKQIGRDERIDVLFTDIVMPGGINGFELARELREVITSE